MNYNLKLRNGETLTETESELVSGLALAIDEAARLRAMVVYRGIPRDFAPEFSLGTFVQDRGFISTSKSPELARAYVEDAYSAGEAIMLRIHVPAGAKGIDVKALLGPDHLRVREEEVILQLGSTFEVRDVDMDEGSIDLSLRVTYLRTPPS